MIDSKINALRCEMAALGIDVYIIPSSDPHQSEYVPDRWKARTWITGFTGSAGTAVITKDKSYLWADGRYHIQAALEIKGSEVELVKWGLEGVPEVHEWLSQNFKTGSVVGFDGDVVSLSMKRAYDLEALPKEYTYITNVDLISKVWKDRPEFPSDKIYIHEMPYASNTVGDKLGRIRKIMNQDSVDYLVVTTLDDIAWMFNFRGTDISYSPVALAYAVIGKDSAWLFIDENKLNDQSKVHFSDNAIRLEAYTGIKSFLSTLPSGSKVSYDPGTLSVTLYEALPDGVVRSEKSNPVAWVKSMKTPEEIENIRKSQLRDGVAMVRFIKWLEETVPTGKVTELTVEDKLRELRAQEKHFVSESFHTIAAFKEHAAMMHYSANTENAYTLKNEGLFLFDSGGNYLDGTTDITRTVALGPVTDEMKKDYTLTLKSHIALARLRFLHGATGSKIEMVARQPMWAEGLDYKCGTGHGLGYFMNVHEGPQTMKMLPNNVKLQPGMLLTNEPGVYKEGRHGIRIENTVVIQKDIETEFGQFLNFETVSFCPIDTKPIQKDLLTSEELMWLNNYHASVYEKLSPMLNDEEASWLKAATQAI